MFTIVMDKIIKNIQRKVLWCLLFADDIVWVGENMDEVNSKL